MEEFFLYNHNYRTRYSTNLVRCSFSSLLNSLEAHYSIYFFFISLGGFIERKFLGQS